MKGDDAMDYQIIAVDFDGTLCFSNWPELGEPNRPLIEYQKLQRSSGNKLILWTCRAGEALEKAVSWCRDQQLEFDAVNDNLPEIIEMYGTNSRKITCDFYIDDKAVLPAMKINKYFHKIILLQNFYEEKHQKYLRMLLLKIRS